MYNIQKKIFLTTVGKYGRENCGRIFKRPKKAKLDLKRDGIDLKQKH